MDKIREIDYLVYEYIINNDEGFLNYLRETKDSFLVKNYCTDMAHACSLIPRLSKKYDFNLVKLISTNNYECILRSGENETGYGKSKLPSLAICLAILDVNGTKDLYIDTAEKFVKQLEEDKKERIEELRSLGIDGLYIDDSLI